MPTIIQTNSLKSTVAIAKYQVAIDKNTSEGEILWNRYNALLVFNSLLITGIGFLYKGDDKGALPTLIAFSLPIAGLVSCYLWFIVTHRSFQWIKYWITSARKIEEKYLIDDNSDLNPISNGKNHKENIIGWPQTQAASYTLILITGAIYLLFFVFLLL